MSERLIKFALIAVFASPLGAACSGSDGDDAAATPGGSGGMAGGSAGAAAAGKAGSNTAHAGTGTGGHADAGAAGAGAGMAGAAAGAAGEGGEPASARFECGSRETDGATVVNAPINTSQSWSGRVHVQGQVAVGNDATITIAPGTEIVMAADSRLDFGAATSATLIAQGSAEKPVRFCGAQAKAGFWGGLALGASTKPESQLHNVLVSDAGGTTEALGLDASVLVDNVQVRVSGSNGVRAADFGADGSQLSVEGSAGIALVLTTAAAATHFPLGGTFTDNADNTAHLRFVKVDQDSTFSNLGIPYVQESKVVVGAKLTISAGVEYRMAGGTQLEIGATLPGGLSVNGTATAPVVFRGVTATPGSWNGIIVNDNAKTDSVFSYAQIHHGGGNGTNPLYVNAAIKLDHLQLADNLNGLFIAAQGLDASSKNVSVTTTAGAPLEVQPNALVTLPTGGTFTGNARDLVYIHGGFFTAKGTVPNLGIPYELLENVRTRDGAEMTLVAGTQFVAAGDVTLDFGKDGSAAKVIAVGTAAAPIRFKGESHSAGYWQGISVGTLVTGSSFDYVEVSDGGSACLMLFSSQSVTHSKFSNCQGYGILKTSADTRDYVTGNTFDTVGTGGVGNLP